MKIPDFYTGEKPLIYYTVTFFRGDGSMGEDVGEAYKTISSALAAARKAGRAARDRFPRLELVIRKEEVYKRVPGKAEFSSSGPIMTLRGGAC